MIRSLTRMTVALAALLPIATFAQFPTDNRTIVSTIAGDTYRIPPVRTSAQNPPFAHGVTQGDVLLHSGELVVSAIDLNAGGRNGLDVVIDRTYRSSTHGLSVHGSGWSSSITQRLRALPNGSVEYRDPTGEIWTFTPDGDRYTSPPGLMLRLARRRVQHTLEWVLSDSLQRQITFDDSGRITSRTDEFFHPFQPGTGNEILYVYGGDGRLEWIRDPLGRDTRVEWYEATDYEAGAVRGLLARITDWRGRTVTYRYDEYHRLREVTLPAVQHTDGSAPPTIRYEYEAGNGSYNDALEIRGNLKSITDPTGVATGGPPRVTFLWGSGADRDRVIGEQWVTGESVRYSWTSPTEVHQTDALGQLREYTLAGTGANARIAAVIEKNVDVVAQLGALPAATTSANTTAQDRVTRFEYHDDGTLRRTILEGVRTTDYVWDAPGYDPGRVLVSLKTTPASTSAMGAATEADGAITRELEYQKVATAGGSLAAIRINGHSFPTPQPHRALLATTSTLDGITTSSTRDPRGQLITTESSGGIDGSEARSSVTISYHDREAPHYMRGEIDRITSGEVVTRYSYTPNSVTVHGADRIRTVVTFDAWRRPATVERSGRGLVTREQYHYDASGRLSRYVRTLNGEAVTTRFEYDALGRPTKTSLDEVATPGGVLTTSTQYDLENHTITTTHPSGSVLTRTFDPLGRLVRESATTGGVPVEMSYGYDLDDNLVWASDSNISIARAFDAHGRERETRRADGTRVVTSWDDVGNPDIVEVRASDGVSVVSSTDFDFTAAGRLQSMVETIDEGSRRETSFAWDGAGRSTTVASEGRIVRSRFDEAGRWLGTRTGAGSGVELTEVWTETSPALVDILPESIRVAERGAEPKHITQAYDTNHNVIATQLGELYWSQRFDEAGNVVSATPPSLGTTQVERDSRGAAVVETLPGGQQSTFGYDEGGVLDTYVDPTGETAAKITTDLLGRPTVRTYADGTTERIEWDGTRVAQITDRQNRTQGFAYNDRGQVTEIHSLGGEPLDQFQYDDAGRVVKHITRSASIEWLELDGDGNPGRTVVTRYRNASAFEPVPEVAGVYGQDHEWNARGERTAWTMPLEVGATPSGKWTRRLDQTYDALGNLDSIVRTFDDGTSASLLSARYRNEGRADRRTITTACSAPCAPVSIERSYSWDDTMRLDGVSVRSRDLEVAGSEITSFRGLLVQETRAVGQRERRRFRRYDDRGRVRSMEDGRFVEETLDPAEFRESVERSARFAGAERERLTMAGIDLAEIDPPSVQMQRSEEGAHKIGAVEAGTDVRALLWNGAERGSDGRFEYEWDEKGRLIVATEALREPVQPVRVRVRYEWDGNHRMVGRRVETATMDSPDEWTLATAPFLTDGLPAETTFVWDPVSDTIAAVYDGMTGALLRQIIHGGLGYDDPIEIALIDPMASAVKRVYPVFDEADNGNLQAVLDASGNLIARADQADPYGADRSVLVGPAVERITWRAAKGEDGSVEHVDVEVRVSEMLDAASVAKDVRVVAHAPNGEVLRTSDGAAELIDPFTMRLRLSSSEWNALVDGAGFIAAAATSSARGAAWSDAQPILEAPDWVVALGRAMRSAEHPVEVRDSLASLASWLASIPAASEGEHVVYDIDDPALLASGPESDSIIRFLTLSPFQALPFIDSVTGHSLARRRWLDHTTGTFLTPDPLGFIDSPNLYAFAGGDPVNGRDPLGLCSESGEEPCSFLTSARRSALRTIETQLRSGQAAVSYLFRFASREGRRQNAQMTFDAGIRLSECGHDPDCAQAELTQIKRDVHRYLDAPPDLRDEILGELFGRWSVYGAEALIAGRATMSSRRSVSPLRPQPDSSTPGLVVTELTRNSLEYLREIERLTGRRVGASQRNYLRRALQVHTYERLDPQAVSRSRREFNSRRKELIAEWERETGTAWPVYESDVFSATGRVLRRAGQPYDAHHIIELNHGGPHTWWNIHPAKFPDQHQGGIHRGVSRTIFD